MAPMPWFRFYSEAVRDTKLRRIARKTDRPFAETIGIWAIILSFASESHQRGQLLLSDGNPVDQDDISDIAGCNADETLQQLQSNGMVTVSDGVICVSAWNKRQYESDNSTPRVNKFRDKARNVSETLHERFSNADVTPPDTDTESDTEGIVASKSVIAPPMAAPPPKSKPKTAKTPKAPKPPTEPPPPAIVALHEIVGIYPPKETWDLLVNACKGKTKSDLQGVYAEFRLRTPNKHNWSWVTEGVRSYTHSGKPNGKATPNGLPSPEMLWGTVQAEIDRVHYSGVPELPALILEAVEAVGGWYTVCKADPSGSIPSRLRDAYRSLIGGAA